MLYIANSNYVLKAVDSTNVPVDLTTCATVTETLSTNVKVDGKYAVKQLTIVIAGATTSKITDKNGASTVPGVINGTSTETKIDNMKIVLGDKNVTGLFDIATSKVSNCNIAINGTASGQSMADSLLVWVSDAGQNVVKVE